MKFLNKITENPVFVREMILYRRVQDRKNEVKYYAISYFVFMVGFVSFLLICKHFHAFDHILKGSLEEDDYRPLYAVFLFMQGLCYMIIGFNTYNFFTRDREMGAFENLVSTAIKPEDIVLGKFWAAFLTPAKILTFHLPLVLILGMVVKISFPSLILFYLFSLVFCALSAMMGLYISIISRNTGEATSKCIMALITMLLIPVPILTINFFISLSSRTDTSFFYGAGTMFLIIFDPIVTLASLFELAKSGDTLFLGLNSGYSFILSFALLFNVAAACFFYYKTVAKVAEVPGGRKGNDGREKSYRQPAEVEMTEDWIDRVVKKVLPRSWTAFMDNPLFIRDTRIVKRGYEKYSSLKSGERRNRILTFIAVILLVVLIGAAFATGSMVSLKNIYFRLAFFAFFIMMLGFVRQASLLMDFEDTTGGYDTIISSMLTPEKILEGKFWLFLYPALKKIILFSPLIIGGGLLSGFTVPGILALFVLLVSFIVMADITLLYDGIPDVSYQRDNLRDIYSTAVLLFCGGVVFAANLADQAYQFLGFIPMREKFEPGEIFPISELWLKYSKGITDGLDPVTLSATAFFLVIFLVGLAAFMKFMHRKAVEKLGMVPEI